MFYAAFLTLNIENDAEGGSLGWFMGVRKSISIRCASVHMDICVSTYMYQHTVRDFAGSFISQLLREGDSMQ
jgi:hypothetical protein